jgi:glycosyltransferase involved in cell wall biosynthesis
MVEASSPSPEHPLDKIGDLAASAGLQHVHLLAWRDLDDPEAGGSEIHAAHIAQRWAAAGLDVTVRTSFAPNRPQRDRRSGYTVIRKAGRYLVFPRAIASEIAGRMGPRDGLVEIWNGVPFLTPAWARGPRIVFLHHVHGEMWGQVLSPGLARLGQTLESRVAPRLYRRTPIVTLSASSRTDIVERLGVPAQTVHVVEPGVDAQFSPGGQRSPHPLVIVVGRLVPVKRLDAMVDALARVKRDVPALEALLVGEGYERPALDRQIQFLGADEWLHLTGRVSDAKLVELYRRAWVLSSASGHEGWGMTCTEAAACATPAVVSDIPGHHDAVIDGVTGLLAATDDDLAAGLVRVIRDHGLRTRLGDAARARAATLTWDATAFGTLKVLADDAARRSTA